MEFSTLLQIIPILGLVMYMFYMTYFYAFPMFILKILLFYGHIRYRGSFITFRGGKITVECKRDGKPVAVLRPYPLPGQLHYLPRRQNHRRMQTGREACRV